MNEERNPFQSFNMNTELDIELLKKEIGLYFPFYDIKYGPKTVAFFCRLDQGGLEENFDSLRKSLSKKGYIPMLRYEKGEHVIYVTKKPKVNRRPVWVNIVLLIATVFTTALAGSLQWVGIYQPLFMENAGLAEIMMESLTLQYMLDGFLFFSIPLLAILGIHEMGHYFISKKHHLDTSLPFFIPVPPPFILGTFGALISTREPIPSRKALLDVGVSGPICGFLVAIPVSLIGLFLMQQDPIPIVEEVSTVSLTYPLVLQFLNSFFSIPTDVAINTHPTLFAGWVGFFLTAVNLLPVGQLDGGHVSRALLKEKTKYAGWAVMIFLFIMIWVYPGWLIFAIIILFLIGTQHQPPLNELSPLDARRKIIGIIAVIIFIICFAPIPIST